MTVAVDQREAPPHTRLGHSWGPDTPLRSLAGARCAPPLCGTENKIGVTRRITGQWAAPRRV
jgi:hypothetical protein